MKVTYNDENLEKGKFLAKGRGQYDLMDICYKRKWTSKNTILVVEDSDDLDSGWTIYEGVKND